MKRNILGSATFTLAAVLAGFPVQAAPVFSRTTSAGGVQVYQDSEDTNQFWYVPSAVRTTLGEGGSLLDFNVAYYGVGPKYVEENASRELVSVIGASVAGQALIDITEDQRAIALSEIKRAFGVTKARLAPLALRNVEASLVFGEAALGENKVSTGLPKEIQIGRAFNFAVASRSRTFAQFATYTPAQGVGTIANPQFGLNVLGDVEYQGDPWEAEVTINVSQMWKDIRKKFSASASWGWFRLGSADYQSTIQELTRNGVITIKMKEGSLDLDGRHVFETIKKAADQLNSSLAAGEGFFRFEPNPKAAEPGGGGGGRSGLFGWSVSVNLGYSEASLTQNITFKETVSYTGRFRAKVPVALTLAVACTPQTARRFVDLNNATEPCVNQLKIDQLNARMNRQRSFILTKQQELARKLESGQITIEAYRELLKFYNSQSVDEDMIPAAPLVSAVTDPGARNVLEMLTFDARSVFGIKSEAAIEERAATLVSPR